ncbi:MAG: TetR family transcriptional regulator [Candidatus Nanopelagicales bacterium]|jgi:TetR/AcrR family transcriptional regulator, regulator of biofilm formation and stress response|nr:TetR family transcriptional regulator [Candidatus Nanopelagicales bacterium]
MRKSRPTSRSEHPTTSRYDASFRNDAVRRVTVDGETQVVVAREMGVGESTLRRWVADWRVSRPTDSPRAAPRTISHGRHELVEAAVRVVSRGGLKAMTYRSVAAEAGMSHGLVRHYFGNLDELLVVAMEDVVTRIMESAGMLSPSSDVADFSLGLEESVERDAESQAFISEMVVQARRQPKLRPLVAHMYEAFRESTRVQLQQRGLGDDPALAAVVFAALDGLVFQQLALNDPATTRRALNRLNEVLAILRHSQV